MVQIRDHIRIVLGLAALLVAFPASGQGAEPDTTDPARYYPLDVGNEWLYVTRNGDAYTEAVVGDTALVGHTFAVVERDWIGRIVYDGPPPGPSTSRFFVRVDSATARVVVRDTAGVERTDGCPLDAAFGGTSVTCGETEATVNGGYDVDIDLGTAAEVERVQVPAFKHFEGSVSENNIAFRVAYAAGIWRVSEEPGTPFGGAGLVRATIRGTTYGPSVTAAPRTRPRTSRSPSATRGRPRRARTVSSSGTAARSSATPSSTEPATQS